MASLPSLRVMVIVAVVMAAVGFGAHSAMHRKVEVIDDSELEGINELAGELPKVDRSLRRDRPLASATITDVVAAVHHEDSEETSAVQMAGYANDARRESNSPVWLLGTIEDSTPSDEVQISEPAPFRRFNR